MKSLIKTLKERQVMISDGAWGTLLQKKGLQPGECPEAWNLSHPIEVKNIAEEYIKAGSDIVLTNSFGGSRFKLAHYNLSHQIIEINKAAAMLSRLAVGEEHFVMGSLGPTGKMLILADITEDEWIEGFGEQAKALIEGGADSICIETMSALDEALCAIKGIKSVSDCEITCTFTFEKTQQGEYKSMMGVTPVQMAESVIKAGADIIGANCGNGIEGMIDIVKEMRQVSNDIPILIHANAGMPVIQNEQTIFPESPEEMALQVKPLIEAGATIIGGCCGTTPEHIRAMADVVNPE